MHACSFAGREGQAVVRLGRTHFDPDALAAEVLTEQTTLSLTFENDIYSKVGSCWNPT